MWLIVLSPSPHNLHPLFCCVLPVLFAFFFFLFFCFVIVGPYGVVLGYYQKRSRFPFLNHDKVVSYEISLVYRFKYPYSCSYFHLCFLVVIIIIIVKLFVIFSYQRQLGVFHWILCDCKSPLVSRTFLCNLADLSNALVLMVLILYLISSSSDTAKFLLMKSSFFLVN